MKFKLFIWLLTISFLNVMGQTDVTYRYWYDDNDNDFTQGTLSSTKNMELDVSSLDIGLHSVTFQVQDSSGIWQASAMRNFYKIGIDDKIAVANVDYWFDENSSNVMTLNGINGTHAIDVSSLSNGMHFVTFVIKDTKGTFLDSKTALFYKIKENEIAEVGYLEYWFDDKQTNKKKLDGVSGLFDIDVSSLSDGVHHITFVLRGSKNEVLNSQHKFFYKSSKGFPFITKWKYSVNHSSEYSTLYELNTPVDSLSIISMLPVETCPIRSSCFEFRIEDSIPTLYAKNDITFYFYDTDNNMSICSSKFIDESVKEVLNVDEIKSITPGVTETMPRPAENTIQWYKFDAEKGDSIAIKTNYACTIDVFSPTGENVYRANGSDAVTLDGTHLYETGVFYIAIHDVTSKNCNNINVNLNQIDKYAVLSYSSHKMGNGGVNKVRFDGNGYFMLDSILLKQNNTIIPNCGTKYISNTKVDALFDCENAQVGMYDLVMYFPDDTLTVKNAFEIEQSKDLKFTSTVGYNNSVWIGQDANYNVSVKNQSNMTAYEIPIYVYVETPLTNDVPVIDITNMNLPSPLDNVDLSMFTNSEINELKRLAEGIGDGLCFLKIRDVNEKGDSILIQSTYLVVDVLPYETLEFGVNIKNLRTNASVYITIPDEYHSLRLISNPANKLVKNIQLYGIKDWYCCYKDHLKCIVNAVGLVADIVNKVSEKTKNLNAQAISTIVSCVMSAISTLNDIIGETYCREEPVDVGEVEVALNASSNLSLIMSIKDCVLQKIVDKFKDKIGGAMDVWDIISIINSLTSTIYDCHEAFAEKKPGCPPTEPKGGQTSPVNSYDPNDISGYVAESGSLYIGKRVDKVTYMIEFENDSAFATAPAHTILLSDTLDTNVFDVNTITPLKLQIGDKSYDFKTDFKGVATVDMRPDINAIAQVLMNVDNNGVLTWILESLDPMTVEPTTEIENGILPINDRNGKGMGFVTFSVNLNKNLEDGTEVANMANIVFDTNEPIATPYWINETDYVDPISVIDTLECLNDSVINLKFQGFDERSGIWKYDLYYKPGIESDWFILAEGITESSYQLRVYDDISYGFCVVATDKAGNREVKEFNSEINYMNGEVTTGIETIDVNKVNIDDGILYDIMGRRVKNPAPGIYIRNGQKILIK